MTRNAGNYCPGYGAHLLPLNLKGQKSILFGVAIKKFDRLARFNFNVSTLSWNSTQQQWRAPKFRGLWLSPLYLFSPISLSFGNFSLWTNFFFFLISFLGFCLQNLIFRFLQSVSEFLFWICLKVFFYLMSLELVLAVFCLHIFRKLGFKFGFLSRRIWGLKVE